MTSHAVAGGPESDRDEGTVTGRSGRARGLLLLLLLMIVVQLALVAVPVLAMRPFAVQAPWQLDLAFWVRRLAVGVSAAVATLGAVLLFSAWGGVGRLARASLVVGLMVLVGVSALTWVNPFEKMFTPLAASFAPAAAGDFVPPDEMVLAVEQGGDAAAYPVRQLAFHHVVNDVVGGRPVVATY